MLDRGSRLWTIILAGGAGTRLAPLTRALYGRELPKQFAVLVGDRSMLQRTVDRAIALSPPERIIVVVSREHELVARRHLREWPAIQLLVQPKNLDTGPGILIALAHIRRLDRAAQVAVLPADHHVADAGRLLDAIERASAASRVDPSTVTLLGAEPDHPDPDYGWIVRGRALGRFRLHQVQRFVEKPAAPVADRLLREGALWNTFIMVGTVETLWAQSAGELPEHAARLETCRGPRALREAYGALPPASFSKSVLERARSLAVLCLEGAGWSDWGTPRRVFQSLAGTDDHARLVARITAPHRATVVAAVA